MEILTCIVSLLLLCATFRPVTSSIVERELLQDIVTWDGNSLFIHGERIMFFSGEFHPFRLPVRGLWLDIFQKIKALGFTGASFYLHWGLLEGQPGKFSAEGIFAIEPFLEAAKQAGLYLNARPGPYINAESSGGGFPGWMQRVNGTWRDDNDAYLGSTKVYVEAVTKIIERYQITNGGPVILFQPENEYQTGHPNPTYFSYVEKQFRDAGIVVPFMDNDNAPRGDYAPGTPAAVDIYGFDAYPFFFDCSHPNVWKGDAFSQTFQYRSQHLNQSASSPLALPEFQGGSIDDWGGSGFGNCAAWINEAFERVVYKQMYASGARIMSIYMIYGGTNWGNVGHDSGYTSYDYGAAITEERLLTREKYSEVKLQANFMLASPAILTAIPGTESAETYADNADVTVTPLFGNLTTFLVVRHTQYHLNNSTNYHLNISTSIGNFTLPQLGGQLTLSSRDSKIHVVDYSLGNSHLLYSTAEIFTWKAYGSKTVLIVYGGSGEQHELAFREGGEAEIIEGPKPTVKASNQTTILHWKISSTRTVVRLANNLYIFLLDRNTAYNYWTTEIADGRETIAIIKAGYLLRNATLSGTTLSLVGDINATTSIEIIGGAPAKLSKLLWNSEPLAFEQDTKTEVVTATVVYENLSIDLPDLHSCEWRYIDGLPEVLRDYNDSGWRPAMLTKTFNTDHPLLVPASLYGSDYGYHTGSLLLRGHFVANGEESSINLTTQGGVAFGASVWLNETFLGSYNGSERLRRSIKEYKFPKMLQQNASYVLTVVLDNMGQTQGAKDPRGIITYDFHSHKPDDISWKITGNLGGEDYLDKDRGPLNEGAMWPERQGFHLPNPPTGNWTVRSPISNGVSAPGIGWFTTKFDLNLLKGYDIPLSFAFRDSTANLAYRVQLYVNGYQFGKYIPHVGPQHEFPVPEGILNYHGTNWIALGMWAHENGGARLGGLEVVAKGKIKSGYGLVEMSPMTPWKMRQGAY